jgi:DnaJ-class molecular chaperone
MGKSIHVSMKLTMPRTMEQVIAVQCPQCHGSGVQTIHKNTEDDCPYCDGRGCVACDECLPEEDEE